MARVALLIMTTSLFAALWSGDQTEQMASLDRPTKVIVGRRSAAQLPINSAGRSELIGAPLPHGIAAGTYLVSDQWGRTEIRVIAAREALSSGPNAASLLSNHYQVERGSQRWHFIRIERSSGALSHRSKTDSYR